MGNADTDKPSIGRLGSMRRKAVNMSPELLIKTGYCIPARLCLWWSSRPPMM